MGEVVGEENLGEVLEGEKKVEEVRGCVHYKRGCKLVSPCCGKVYSCRFCHDEAEGSHCLDRKSVAEVECLACGARGPAAAACGGCGGAFARAHYCALCRLYDDEDKGQFHCEGCGICRVGGRGKFEHCGTCGLCVPTNHPHRCVQEASKANCPICMEDIHNSRDAAHVPPCAHLLHSKCYHAMVRQGLFSCPTCGRAMQEMDWRAVDREVAATPMPREYQGLHRAILCKDCLAHTTAPFHIVGMKCQDCGGYNTATDPGGLLRRQGEGWRPLTEEEEKALEGATFPPPPAEEGEGDGEEGEEEEEDGWETTEEEMVEEELD